MVRPTGAFVRATFIAGLVAGALDIAAAVLQNLQVGAQVVFQSVATGWIGAAAYEGGWSTAWLGLISHFGLMFGIAGIYVLLTQLRPDLRRRWLLSGMAWGAVVWVVMTYVVVPLSASTLPLPNLIGATKGLVTHVIAVGLPIAYAVRRVLEPAAKV